MRIPQVITEFLERHQYESMTSKSPFGITPIMRAVMLGNTCVVHELLKFNPELHCAIHPLEIHVPMFGLIPMPTPHDGYNALHFAAEANPIILREMLGQVDSFLINKQSSQISAKLTPLHVAISQGQAENVTLLLQYHANPNIQNSSGNNALLHALYSNKISIAEKLLQHSKLDLTITNKKGQDAFLVACKLEMYPVIEKIMQHPSFSFETDYSGESIFTKLAKSGHLTMLAKLLEHIAIFQVDSPALKSAFVSAANGELPPAAKLTLEAAFQRLVLSAFQAYQQLPADEKPEQHEWLSQLFMQLAIFCKNESSWSLFKPLIHDVLVPKVEPEHPQQLMDFLHQHHWDDDADFDAPNAKGHKPLTISVDSGQEIFVEQLLARNVRPERSGCVNTETHISSPDCGALRHAAMGGRPSLLQRILEASPNYQELSVTHADLLAELPIATLSLRHSQQFITLAQWGIDINLPHANLTPLCSAVINGDRKVTHYLLQRTDLNLNWQQPDSLDTALHIATLNGDHDLVAALLERTDINPFLLNHNHESPLHIALQKGDIDVASMLLQAMFQRSAIPMDNPHWQLARDLNFTQRLETIKDFDDVHICRDTYTATLLQSMQKACTTLAKETVRQLSKSPLSYPMPAMNMAKSVDWNFVDGIAPEEKYHALKKDIIKTALKKVESTAPRKARLWSFQASIQSGLGTVSSRSSSASSSADDARAKRPRHHE